MAAARLAQLTGLTPTAAERCIKENDGSFGVALASFVQCRHCIPDSYVADPKAAEANTDAINNALKGVYAAVQAYLAQNPDAGEDAAWASIDKSTVWVDAAKPAPTPGPNGPAAKPAAAAPAAAKPAAAQPAAAKPAAAAPAPAQPAAAKPAAGGSVLPTPDAGASSSPPKARGPPPGRFTGCFLDMPKFWDEEVVANATLLTKNFGFLEKTGKEALRARMEKWVDGAKFYKATPIDYVPIVDRDEEIVRVIIKDSVRTFFHDDHRAKFEEYLYAMRMEFGDYGQAMSYVAGICLLTLDEQETAAILRRCVKEFIGGHWSAEAVGFATNAWLWEAMLKKIHPDIAKHFDKLNFWPDTFLQKLFSGLGVHVLRFEELFPFLDEFFQGGLKWLFKYAFAIVEHFRDQILKVTAPEQINELYEIMRLDSRASEPEDHIAIFNRAKRMQVDEVLANMDIERMQVYNTKVAPRLARAPKTVAFEPCGICDTNKPKWWCDGCDVAICEECHKAEVGGHEANHPLEKWA